VSFRVAEVVDEPDGCRVIMHQKRGWSVASASGDRLSHLTAVSIEADVRLTLG
jgi:hypothetical protein